MGLAVSWFGVLVEFFNCGSAWTSICPTRRVTTQQMLDQAVGSRLIDDVAGCLLAAVRVPSAVSAKWSA